MPNRLDGIRILDGRDEWMDPIVLSIHSNNHHSTIYEKYHSAIHKSPILPTNTPQSTILSILNRNRRHLSLFRLAQPLHVRQSPSLQHTHLLLTGTRPISTRSSFITSISTLHLSAIAHVTLLLLASAGPILRDAASFPRHVLIIIDSFRSHLLQNPP